MKLFIKRFIPIGEVIPKAWVVICQHGTQIRLPLMSISYISYAKCEMECQAAIRIHKKFNWNWIEFLWLPIEER